MREKYLTVGFRDEPEELETQDLSVIESFLRIDRVGAAASVVVVTGGWILGIGETNLLLTTIAAIIALLAALSIALARLDPDRVSFSLTLATVGNWLVALNVAFVVPQLWPVMIMTVLMPVVLATPFLGKQQLIALLVATAAMMALVSATGLTNDDGGVVPDLEDGLELLLVVSAVMVISIPITLVAWNNNRLLQGRLGLLRELNQELTISRSELAESRRRVVDAGDTERRRIERDLHDGAQQRLVSLGVRLRLLEATTGPDHELASNVQILIEEANEAVDELRSLAQGIYPPLLESSGVAAALRAAARRSGLDISADLDDVGRLGAVRERALYFVGLEALTNAAKYAADSEVTVLLASRTHGVILEIRDNGPGYDPHGPLDKNGIDNMGDRMAAVGGTLTITSSPGNGTSIVAQLPANTD